MEPQWSIRGPCDNSRAGDCDPDMCEEGSCESKYTRFWDPKSKIDRTRKSCQCIEREACSIIGMNSYSGCRSYMFLNSAGQKIIREWTMSASEKLSRKQSLRINSSEILTDKIRHYQLQNGHTRFCCKTSRKRRRFVAAAMNGLHFSNSECTYTLTALVLFSHVLI
uniref:Uncharacterized protein n=1 Tax=Panagrolaimus sp. JU765 TaxID=591449 RepID=A0AC34Q5C5_9BILA